MKIQKATSTMAGKLVIHALVGNASPRFFYSGHAVSEVADMENGFTSEEYPTPRRCFSEIEIDSREFDGVANCSLVLTAFSSEAYNLH